MTAFHKLDLAKSSNHPPEILIVPKSPSPPARERQRAKVSAGCRSCLCAGPQSPVVKMLSPGTNGKAITIFQRFGPSWEAVMLLQIMHLLYRSMAWPV